MFLIYQITQYYISNAINALHNGDYSNLIAIMQAFEMFTKIVY